MDNQKAKAEKEQKPALEEDTAHAVVVSRPEPAESREIRKTEKSEPPQDILVLENGNIIIN